MGNVAGSGGYYVACGADMIFADSTTITASIGVVGGKIVTTGGWNKLGINWKANQRGEMAEAAGNLEFEKAASLRDRIEDVLAIMAMEGSRKRRTPARSRRRRKR